MVRLKEYKDDYIDNHSTFQFLYGAIERYGQTMSKTFFIISIPNITTIDEIYINSVDILTEFILIQSVYSLTLTPHLSLLLIMVFNSNMVRLKN